MTLVEREMATGEKGPRRLALLVAVIAATAGILGAVGGSYASYLGNKSVEQSKTKAAARGTARVLQARFSTVGVRFRYMLTRNRLVEKDGSFAIAMPVADEELLASNLDADQWGRVAAALASLRLFVDTSDRDFQYAQAGLPASLDQRHRSFVQSTFKIVRAGEDALGPLAEG
jgi:hypothetical protein